MHHFRDINGFVVVFFLRRDEQKWGLKELPGNPDFKQPHRAKSDGTSKAATAKYQLGTSQHRNWLITMFSPASSGLHRGKI